MARSTRPAPAPLDGVQVPVARSAAGTTLTAAQVCSLPMEDLLAQVRAELDTTDITANGFFGYVTVRESGRITVHTPVGLDSDARDAAIRFFITKHLGLPSDLFPSILQVDVFHLGSEV
ncbi:hypothetical protein [Streptomyces sp. NPDC044948]|uniref:hypothetical protein n=1 Tax=Streptomyces sp. NPDC044948 TaxID=3157092 RepID=UPI0033DC2018